MYANVRSDLCAISSHSYKQSGFCPFIYLHRVYVCFKVFGGSGQLNVRTRETRKMTSTIIKTQNTFRNVIMSCLGFGSITLFSMIVLCTWIHCYAILSVYSLNLLPANTPPIRYTHICNAQPSVCVFMPRCRSMVRQFQRFAQTTRQIYTFIHRR